LVLTVGPEALFLYSLMEARNEGRAHRRYAPARLDGPQNGERR